MGSAAAYGGTMANSKKLVVCADGTWNDEDGGGAPTNVARLHHALQTVYVEGVDQWAYYHSGVGTRWGERLTGGAFGYGINRNIIDCYRFLVENYAEGDEIHLFGFSRGAYTVRSLAGLIRNSGIVKDPAEIPHAFRLYRDRSDDAAPSGKRAKDFRVQHAKKTSRLAHAGDSEDYVNSPEIKLIGVWDTVGSLGYPLPFFSLWKHLLPLVGIDWWFHDTNLSTTVRYAYQAVAIHERRSDFPPTLWDLQMENGQPKRGDQVLEQVYFTGVHCDVGGGYGGAALSDVRKRSCRAPRSLPTHSGGCTTPSLGFSPLPTRFGSDSTAGPESSNVALRTGPGSATRPPNDASGNPARHGRIGAATSRSLLSSRRASTIRPCVRPCSNACAGAPRASSRPAGARPTAFDHRPMASFERKDVVRGQGRCAKTEHHSSFPPRLTRSADRTQRA
jgi:hypothetical protein